MGMQQTLADVERGLLARARHVEELQRAISHQYVELEQSRSALRRTLSVLSAELQKSADADRGSAFQFAGVDEGRGEAEDGAVTGSANSVDAPQSQAVLKTTALCSQEVLPLPSSTLRLPFVLATLLPPPAEDNLPTPSAATCSFPTHEVRERSCRCQQRCLLHAAKLQFAEEWTRLGLPWFENAVRRQFFLPLSSKLQLLERRLDRLCTRMSLNIPQYTLRGQRGCGEAADSAACAPASSTGYMSTLWHRYINTATQKFQQDTPSSDFWGRTTALGRLTETHPPRSEVEAESESENMQTKLHAGDASEIGITTAGSDEVVIVAAPATNSDNTEMSRMLLRTRRTLRHVWFVMRYGLLEGGEGACAGASPCPLASPLWEREGMHEDETRASAHLLLCSEVTNCPHEMQSWCKCCPKDDRRDACLACRVVELLRRHDALASSPCAAKHFSEEAGFFDAAYTTGGAGVDRTRTHHAALSLLSFLHHLCTLHQVVQAKQSRTGHVDDAQNTPALHGVAATECAAYSSAASCTPLEQLVLPPFHLLDASVAFLQGSQDKPTRSALAEVVSLLQWWRSPVSCDCRCFYARLVRLSQLYRSASQGKHAGSINTGLSQSSSLVASLLAASERLCRRRSAERQMREHWEELHARLLVARSATSSITDMRDGELAPCAFHFSSSAVK